MNPNQSAHAAAFLRDVALDIFETFPLQANGLANLAAALDPAPSFLDESFYA